MTENSKELEPDHAENQMDFLERIVGNWEGECRTWFEPGKLADESTVKAQIQSMLDDRIFRHTYESTIQGQPRSGEETLVFNSAKKLFQTAWFDSFHMNYGIMFSEGEPTQHGFVVTGSYDVGGDNPPWGWKTAFELADDDHLTITAYNVTPDGDEMKAVETKYKRVNA